MVTRESNRRTGIGMVILCLTTSLIVDDASAQQSAPPPADKQEISLAPRWTKGETRIYEQIKIHRDAPQGQAAKQVSSRARLDIKVVEAGKKGYTLSWKVSEKATDKSPPPEQGAELAGLLKAMEDWNVLLDLDESGNFLGVRNWKEIKSRTEALNDAILRNGKYLKLRPKEQAKMRSQLKARIETKEQIEELCTREAKAFLAPIGLRFKSGQPIRYETQFPNPRGGKPFPAHSQFEVVRIDPDSGRALVDWRQVIDSKGVGQGLGGSVDRLAQSRPPGPGFPDPPTSLTIRDECRYLMDTRTGWVMDMNHLRIIRSQEGSTNEESLRIRRFDASSSKGQATPPTAKPGSATPSTR